MQRKLGLKIQSTHICNIMMFHCSNPPPLPPKHTHNIQISSFLYLQFSEKAERKGALQWVSNILSVSHCCNLVKDREAICMEMRQRGLTLQNQARIHSYSLFFPSNLQKYFIICTLLQKHTIFILRAGHCSSTFFI